MPLGHDKRVAGADRTDVQKCQRFLVLVNFERWELAAGYFAENTFIHKYRV